VLYLRKRGWIAFNGRFWDLERGGGLARRAANTVGQGLMRPGGHPRGALETRKASAKARQAVWDFATQAGNNGRISAMLSGGGSYLEVDVEDFDTDPLALNCENGVVRFVRGPRARPWRGSARATSPATG
jgi:putative DNA primase/helicase